MKNICFFLFNDKYDQGTYKGVHLDESCTSNYASLRRALSFIGGLGLAAPGGAREPVPILSSTVQYSTVQYCPHADVQYCPTMAQRGPRTQTRAGGELWGFRSKLCATISYVTIVFVYPFHANTSRQSSNYEGLRNLESSERCLRTMSPRAVEGWDLGPLHHN